jgi:hypothetical protein
MASPIKERKNSKLLLWIRSSYLLHEQARGQVYRLLFPPTHSLYYCVYVSVCLLVVIPLQHASNVCSATRIRCAS